MDITKIQTTNADEQVLQTLDDSGRAPKSRVANARSAFVLVDRLKREADTTAQYRAKIQGLIDGNVPYDPAALRRLGQAWRANVNFRGAESIIDQNAAAYWELDMEVPTLIQAYVAAQDPQRPSIDYGMIIAEEYTRTLLDWPGYYYNKMLCVGEMLKYGVGPIYWPDADCWKFEAMKTGMFLLPSDARSTLDRLDFACVRHSYRVHELYRLISTPEMRASAREEGWDTDEIRLAILRAAKSPKTQEGRYLTSTWEALQQSIKNSDYSAAYVTCDPINVVHLLVREFDNKVSHLIICEDEQRERFLFSADSTYEQMDRQIQFFLYGIGDGYIRSVKGLGHRIYSHEELNNRFMNSMLDGAILSASLLIQPQSGAGKKGFQLTRVGPVTQLPEGFNPVQSSFAPNLTQLAAVRTMLLQDLNMNTGVFKQDPKAQEGKNSYKTAREATMDEMKGARLEKNQISFHYLHLDRMHKEIFRRLTNKDYPEKADGYEEAQAFRKRCLDRGVPAELLDPEKTRVCATRAIGYGSTVMRSLVTQEVLGLSPLLDEVGRTNAIRDRLAALVGHSMVDRYLPLSSRNKIPTSEHSLATLENNDMQGGQQVMVGNDQPHPIHLSVHFPMAAAIAQQFQQDPRSLKIDAAVRAMQLVLQHINGHVAAMSRDKTRKNEVKAALQSMKALAGIYRQMLALFEKAKKQLQERNQQQAAAVAQAQQQVPDPELQVKLAEVQRGFQVKMYSAQTQNAIRERKAEHAMMLADQRAAAEIERRRATDAAIRRDDADARALEDQMEMDRHRMEMARQERELAGGGRLEGGTVV